MTTAEFNRLLADTARQMQVRSGTSDTLEEAVAAAGEVVGGCDLAAVSVTYPDRIETPAATDDTVRRIENLQFTLGEGPCRSAMREHETVHSPDVANDPRWPVWGARIAEELGVRSALGLRLFSSGETLGSLDLYSRTVRGFDSDDIYHGVALAAHVGVALAATQQAEHLRKAITNRTVIGQAEGILMERFAMTPAQAFAVLRRISSHTNTKLSQVAQTLVTTRQTPH